MNHQPHTTMLIRSLAAAAFIAATLLLTGCPAPPETVKTERPPAPAPRAEKKPAGPDITVNIASINLATVNRRIEKGDIEELCRTLLREKADIIAVEGMTRYPGVATRIDVFQEIATGTGMRSAFGETNTVSGRQGGNALYSTFPINSHENTPYTGISSTNFESALLGLVDAGAREIAVVSTLLPEHASATDQLACEAVLGTLVSSYSGTPVIITGNLPPPPASGAVAFRADQADGGAPVRTWYEGEGLRHLGSRTIESRLGRILLTQFGVYRKGPP